ncbi:MAG: serine hydrolase domain-containing protein [Spirochaetaceae bacterium]
MSKEKMEQKMQHELDSLFEKNRDIFSTAAGIRRCNDGFAWRGASGFAYAGKGTEMTAETTFYASGITKMYTAVCIMILEERGKLSLEDPLSRYIPAEVMHNLHIYKKTDYSDSITLYHLLSHTSGLPDYFAEKIRKKRSLYDRFIRSRDLKWNWREAVGTSKKELKPKFPPRDRENVKFTSTVHYSDTNYQLLGAVIEQVTGKPLENVYHSYIIKPLRLKSTYLYRREEPPTAEEKSEVPYSSREGTPAHIYYSQRPLFLDKTIDSLWADGGIVTNVPDSLVFLCSLMEGKLFKRNTTLEKMQQWWKTSFVSPFRQGLGLMQYAPLRVFSPLSGSRELIGYCGYFGTFLFYSVVDRVCIAGTLNQVSNRKRSFRLILRFLRIARKSFPE